MDAGPLGGSELADNARETAADGGGSRHAPSGPSVQAVVPFDDWLRAICAPTRGRAAAAAADALAVRAAAASADPLATLAMRLLPKMELEVNYSCMA